MTGIWYRGAFSPRIVYVPFIDMIRGPIDTILNVFLFIPMGLFLPLLYDKFAMVGKVLLGWPKGWAVFNLAKEVWQVN